MPHEDWQEQKRSTWDAVADGWDRHRDAVAEQSGLISSWMVENLDLRPGDIVLDLGAGNGETGFLASPVVGDSGLVLATDLSPAMLDIARKGAAARGLRNVEVRIIDLQSIALDDASVDGVLCRWGYQQVPDPRRAFREAHRVLRPRRRLSLSVWADDARNPLRAAVDAALAPFDPPPAAQTAHASPYSPPEPTLETAEEVGSLLCEAGFVDVLVQETPLTWHFDSEDDLWSFVADLFGAAAAQIAGLDAHGRAGVRRNLVAALSAHRSGYGYDIAELCLNAIATRA